MKKLLFISFTLITFNILSQASIWVTSKNISEVQKSPEFISNLKSLKSDFVISQAFPSSRNPELLSVYEISCSDCNEVDLYSNMHKVPGLSGIEYTPDYETLELPNDYSTMVNNNWALNLIGAEAAWSYTHGDTSITLAISDQNYYQNHEDLIGKIKYYDATNTATRTHGTAVANIAAGNTNNSVGMSSIGYNSTLALFRMNYNDVLKASYAGYRVVNMSWASGCSYNSYAELALQEAYNNGTFLVAAAGNGTTCGGASNLVYPASYNNVFSVSSVGWNDSHLSSNGTTHQHNSYVDLCAPGYNVPLTAAPGWYITSSGTSFAAPFVTGTVGLMLSVNPNLTNSEIETILKSTAVDIYSINSQFIGQLGSGRLNSAEAVRVAYEMTIVVDNDHDNGHGNNEGGFDPSNPGNGNQGGNGNHNGWNNSHNPLSDNLIENNIKIYPNPSIGTFNLVGLNSNSNIYDSFGKIVMELNAVDFQQVEIKIPGVYYLDLGSEIKKIVIQ